MSVDTKKERAACSTVLKELLVFVRKNNFLGKKASNQKSINRLQVTREVITSLLTLKNKNLEGNNSEHQFVICYYKNNKYRN